MCSELGILHPTSVFSEVISTIFQAVACEVLKDKVNFTFEEVSLEVFFPVLSSNRVVRETLLRGSSQMLAGMKPIHHLYCAREIISAQAPNPGRTIRSDHHETSVGDVVLDG